jgi:hypothetical protein
LALFIVAAILLPSLSQGQTCGTVLNALPQIDEQALARFKQTYAHRRGGIKNEIGITIHIVEQVSGASNIEIEQLYRELDAVNSMFTASGFQFFFCGSPRYISGGKSIYTYNEAADLLNSRFHVPNTINIFYLDQIGSQELSSFACGISTFPFASSADTRFIIMQKGCSTNGSTLAHEIGHFFGLLHTHETARGGELVDRSNCDSAGDLLCDTPADPNLAVTGLTGCTYEAAFTDPRGDRYLPDPSNIMSYAPASCRRRFSNDQNMLMNFWYETTLSYLLNSCDFYPDFAIISTDTKVSTASGQTVDLPFVLNYVGEDQPQKVAVEVLLQSSADVVPFIIFRDSVFFDGTTDQIDLNFPVFIPFSRSSGTYTLTGRLDPRGDIIERDKRNNDSSIELTVDNSRYLDAQIFPNPAQDVLKVFLRDKNLSGDVFYEVSDLYGRQYFSVKNFKSREELFIEIDLNGLQRGPYIITVYFELTDRTRSFLFIKE